ncbi:transposase [Geminocystis sp. NIES-3709]|uniref:transposase n=1 Tax=Geminocystis sp. NIES-3709 TaxID=1617448 RepID=UPI0005FC83AD|nr:transposase [Geminocystis sp. NIES-3709]BAQ65712.1 mobile element protein [Geminocystis sp. NIES-3709]
MCLKYCHGSARKAERIWGWGRDNVQLGLEEERTGIICLGTQSMSSGRKKWEQKYPEVANVLKEIAEAHCQQEPSFKTSIAYTRLTASSAMAELKKRGFTQEEILPGSTMAIILNRMGYRLTVLRQNNNNN